jgi:ectoine hydroxylase-related dioxygenase (phytanoyl-CoA dioxygenase family)
VVEQSAVPGIFERSSQRDGELAGVARRRCGLRDPTPVRHTAAVDADDVVRFEAFGFVVLRGLLGLDEVKQLRSEVVGALTDAFGEAFGRNARAEGTVDVAVPGNFLPLMADASPLSQALVVDDPRLPSVAAALLDDFTVASPALAACLVGQTPWHNDAGTGSRWVRVNAYLDPVTATSGALRVVPATHHGSLPVDIARQFDAGWSRGDPFVLPGVALETSPGDVVVFDPRVHHGSWGGRSRLRWSVDYAAMAGVGDLAARAKLVALIEDLSDWPTTAAWPTWSQWTAGADRTAARARAIATLQDLGVLPDVQTPTA